MAYISDITNDYFQSVANGDIQGESIVVRFGKNQDVDTANSEDIWAFGSGAADYVLLSVAALHQIVSDNANDTLLGTGARTVLVTGLNGSYSEVSETVSMNGLTNVNTVNSYIFISSIVVLTAGANGANIGTITALTSGVVKCAVPVAKNASNMAIFLVPAGHTAFLHQIEVSMQNIVGNATSIIELFLQDFGGVLRSVSETSLSSSGNTISNTILKTPIKLEEKTFTKARATVGTNNTEVRCNLFFILKEN